MAIVTLVIGAVLSAALGHHIRRSEHLRERRVDAFSSVLRTFLEVQTTARDLWKWSTPKPTSSET